MVLYLIILVISTATRLFRLRLLLLVRGITALAPSYKF
jgi:hypothetical protein